MRIISIAFIFLLGMVQVAWADSPEMALSKSLQNYTTYQASFSQTNSGGKEKTQHSQGRVYIQRPGRFRWETSQPYQQVVIANGGHLWIYDKDLKQATQQSMAKRGFNPAELLTEPVSNLAQKFTVSQDSTGSFKLVPMQGGKGFKAAFLKFQGGQLVSLKIINQLNQTNMFTFSQIRVNQTLPSSLFEFKPPAGVQVLRG